MSTIPKPEQKIVVLGKPVKLLSEESIPAKRIADSAQFVKSLLQIPKGKAVGLTHAETGIKPYSMQVKITQLKKDGLLPKSFFATLRKTNGKQILYIVNSAKSEE